MTILPIRRRIFAALLLLAGFCVLASTRALASYSWNGWLFTNTSADQFIDVTIQANLVTAYTDRPDFKKYIVNKAFTGIGPGQTVDLQSYWYAEWQSLTQTYDQYAATAYWYGATYNSVTEDRSYQIPAGAPNSSDATIPYGQSWRPTWSGGYGGPYYYWCVAGYTNWNTGFWSPPATGTFTFYAGIKCSAGYSGNANDPIQGRMVVNFSPYTLTVVPGTSVAPTSSNATIRVGQSWTPSLSGASPGTLYWCIAGATNWQTTPWTPTTPGTYSLYVAVKPAQYYAAGNANDPIVGNLQVNFSPYTVTVTN